MFGGHNTNPMTIMSPYVDQIEDIINTIGFYEVTPRLVLEAQAWLVNRVCYNVPELCRYVIYSVYYVNLFTKIIITKVGNNHLNASV